MSERKVKVHLRLSDAFFDGYARAMDLSGNSKQWPDLSNNWNNDYRKLRSDWVHVGEAIRKATREEYGVGNA